MSFEISFLAPEAAKYATGLASLPFPSMRDVEAEVEKEQQPAVGRGVGALLRTLTAATGGKRVLEVGCNLGYSALWMAAGLAADGKLDTIEMDAALADRARAHFEAAGVGDRATVHVGKALDVLPRLNGPYDLIFIDAAKAEYPAYLVHARRLLRDGGIVAADNMFWLGRVWDATDQDADTKGVREYAALATRAAAWASSLVPIEDGVMVSVKQGKP